jgi:hypothetical protein
MAGRGADQRDRKHQEDEFCLHSLSPLLALFQVDG